MNLIAPTSSFTKPTPKADLQVAETKQAAAQLVDGTKHAATRLADNAKDEIGKRLTSEKDRAVGAVETIAGAMRHTAEELEELGPLPEMVERAADGIERVAEFVQTRSPSELLREVERYARREPAMFIGGAFMLGLFGARLMKSNANRPIDSSDSTDSRASDGSPTAQFDAPSPGRLPPANPPPKASSSTPHPGTPAKPDEEHAVSTPPPPFPSASATPKPYGGTPAASAHNTMPGLGSTNGNGLKPHGTYGDPGRKPTSNMEGP